MKKTALMVMCLSICVLTAGCDSLRQKFVRKRKEPPKPVEMVLEPQDYGDERPAAEELYERYFLFWHSWHDEFISALQGDSRKRRDAAAGEALKNLAEMSRLLDGQARERLAVYVRRLESLSREAAGDVYCVKASAHAAEAEKIKRLIKSGFSKNRVSLVLP